MDVPKISWTLVHAQLAVLSAIGGATGAWCTWRQIYKRRLEREGESGEREGNCSEGG